MPDTSPTTIDTADWISAADTARLLELSKSSVATIGRAHHWRTMRLGASRLYHRQDVDVYRRRRIATKLARQLGRTDPRHIPLADVIACPVCGAIAAKYLGASLCQDGHRLGNQIQASKGR